MDYKEANNILRELDEKYHILKRGQFNFKKASDFYDFAKTGKCGSVEAIPFNELPLETQKKLKDELKVFNDKTGFLDRDGEELFAADAYLCGAKAPGYEQKADDLKLANFIDAYQFKRQFRDGDAQIAMSLLNKEWKNIEGFDKVFMRFDRMIEGRVKVAQEETKQAPQDKSDAKSIRSKTLRSMLHKVSATGGAIGLAAAAAKLAMDDENSNPQANAVLKSGKDR